MNLQDVFALFGRRAGQRWFGMFSRSRPAEPEPEPRGIQPLPVEMPPPPAEMAAVEAAPTEMATPPEPIPEEPSVETAVMALPDPEAEALALEISSLKGRIADLSTRRMEMEQLVQRFEYSQYQVLGERLAENLRLRHEYLSLKARRSGRAEDLEAQREAAEELEAYRRGRETGGQDVPSLAEEERDELKRLYRAVAMRCHPDRVTDGDKAAAHDFFLRTQAAYRQNDLDALRLIHRQITEGGSFGDEPAASADVERLRRTLSDLQDQATDLILAIQTMQLDEVYRKARHVDDWDDYFASVRELLEAESYGLKQKIRQFSTA